MEPSCNDESPVLRSLVCRVSYVLPWALPVERQEHGGALEVDRGGHGVRVAAGSGVGLALGQLGVDRGGGGGGAGGGRRGIVRVDARGARAPTRAHGRVGVELVVERGRAVGHL